jgi:hypothetical protein
MSALAAASASGPAPLVILLLVNGLSPADLTSVLSKLKSQSKDIGSSSRREFFWVSYEDILSSIGKFSNVDRDDGKLFGLVKYSKHTQGDARGDDEGVTSFEEFTRNQRAMVNAGAANVHTMLGRKIRVMDDDEDSAAGAKDYMMAWFDEAASEAYNDITAAEACVSIDSERGVYVGTKCKRKLCRGVSGSATKNIAGLVEFVEGLAPGNPLLSINWHGNSPPSVNSYNVVLTGSWSKSIVDNLPDTIGYVSSTSNDEIYGAFKERKNMSLIGEAEGLIDKMQTDVSKGASNMCYFVASMKDLSTARRNALLKRVYVSVDKKKFIDSVKAEGDVEEMYVIHPRKEGSGKFEEFGGVVFETFYKLDLSIY